METLQTVVPPRGRGRGRGSLSYLSLQQSLDNLPPPAYGDSLPHLEAAEHQFDDAPGAYPRLSSPQSSSPNQRLQQQPPPPIGPFSTPPPAPGKYPTPPPTSTPTPPPSNGYASPPPPTPPPPQLTQSLPVQHQQQLPPKPPTPTRPPPEIVVRTAANNKTGSDELLEQLKPYFPDGVEDVARSIHAICIVDREFSKVAARCCQNLSFLEKGGPEFRSFLLRGLQSDFKNRATIFEKSESDFLSCVVLLCQVFAEMRDRSGLPLLPLATPVVEYLSMMLQDFSLTNDASQVLSRNLTLIGPVLRQKAPDKEQALIEIVRQKILDSKTESLTRCRLLRVLESSWASWQPLPKRVLDFYESSLNNLQ